MAAALVFEAQHFRVAGNAAMVLVRRNQVYTIYCPLLNQLEPCGGEQASRRFTVT